MAQKLKYTLLGFLLAVLGLWGLAVTIPNTFSSGEVVSAAKMNQNFQALKAAVDALETKVASLEHELSTLPTRRGYPRAYAHIDSDGTVTNSFSTTGATITANKTDTGRYEIDFGDVAIFYNTDPVAVAATTDERVCATGSISNHLIVECTNLNGTAADSRFWVLLFNQ